MVFWLVLILQTLFVPFGQRETGDRCCDHLDRLGVDCAQNRERDVPALVSPTDEHPEGVAIDVLDVCGGFDDAASDKASLPLDQLGGGETVGEEEEVQTGDTTEGVD
jgi:hypothetical protein